MTNIHKEGSWNTLKGYKNLSIIKKWYLIGIYGMNECLLNFADSLSISIDRGESAKYFTLFLHSRVWTFSADYLSLNFNCKRFSSFYLYYWGKRSTKGAKAPCWFYSSPLILWYLIIMIRYLIYIRYYVTHICNLDIYIYICI